MLRLPPFPVGVDPLLVDAVAHALGRGPAEAAAVLRTCGRANVTFHRDYARLARGPRRLPAPPAWPEAEPFLRALRHDGRPLVLATLHAGTYLSDLLSLARPLAWLGRVTAIRRERGNPAEAGLLEAFRRAGLRVELVRTRERPARAALRALRRGEHVLLLYDVPPTFDLGRTFEAPFLGARGRFPAGPAALARRAGALLWPFAVTGGPGRRLVHGDVLAPGVDADIAAATRQLARFAERRILAEPERWLLWHHLPAFRPPPSVESS
jgi:lauroyl/myristoyl acyltransferase